MKRFSKPMYGVTLLEIMLVLAVASLILIMGVKYYRSATASRQANDALNAVQAIMSLADNIASSSGSYTAPGLNTAALAAALPNGGHVPWDTTNTYSIATTSASYVVTMPNMPPDVCPLVVGKISGLKNFTSGSTTCGTTATSFTYTYANTSGF